MNLELMVSELLRDEALRKKPYLDSVGKLTIGVGRNLADVGISESEALLLLQNDIERAVHWLNTTLPWWTQLSEARQRVLVNMTFNLGPRKLLTFVNTLRYIQEGRYAEASEAMRQSKWAEQVGERAQRLAAMMKTG